MGSKIFISYKYADNNVERFPETPWYERNIVRDYVNKLEEYIDKSSNIYKGESEGEDLSFLSEDQIWEKLKDRVYDSSVTIIMISPNMKESYLSDKSQWIPWEVSFSLKEITRSDRTSHSNAMMAIILPDINGNYDYYLTESSCGSVTHHTDRLFKIISDNKFNIISPNRKLCPTCGNYHYWGNASYIEAVKWCDFINLPNYYIEQAIERKKQITNYDIHKEI